MSRSTALRLRLLLVALMSVPALGADGCNCSGRKGHSDDAQGAPAPPVPGTLQFGVANFDVSAHIEVATITVNRTGGSLGAVSINYATADGSATSGSGDYTPANGTLSWPDGDVTPRTFTVTIADDNVLEGSETVTLTLTGPTGGATAGPSATMTIVEAWTKFATNPILSPGSGFDSQGCFSPNVIRRAASDYYMIYNGFNGIDQYGTTTSANGVTWPNGGSVFTTGAAGKFDESFLWDPCVVYDPTLTPPYHMWYTGENAAGVWSIGYATSTDGNSWARQNNGDAVFTATPGGWDSAEVYFCHVIRDGSLWKMWYTSRGGLTEAIGYAESSNGINWTRMGPTVGGFTPGPVFQGSGAAGSFDQTHITTPTVIKVGGVYKMLYAGWNSVAGTPANPLAIGYARSTNGQSWTRYVGNPVIPRGAANAWDDNFVAWPSIIQEGNGFRAYYNGINSTGGWAGISIGTTSNP